MYFGHHSNFFGTSERISRGWSRKRKVRLAQVMTQVSSILPPLFAMPASSYDGRDKGSISRQSLSLANFTVHFSLQEVMNHFILKGRDEAQRRKLHCQVVFVFVYMIYEYHRHNFLSDGGFQFTSDQPSPHDVKIFVHRHHQHRFLVLELLHPMYPPTRRNTIPFSSPEQFQLKGPSVASGLPTRFSVFVSHAIHIGSRRGVGYIPRPHIR